MDTTDVSDYWNCDSDLKKEWESFAADSSKLKKRNSISDEWLSFWLHKIPPEKTEILVQRNSLSSQETEGSTKSIKDNIQHACCSVNDLPVSVPSDTQLTSSQLQQISALALELVDTFETGAASVSDEIKDELETLPQKGRQHLLREMTPQLSDQGAYNLCVSLLESDENPWVDVESVLEYILCPMVCANPPKPAGAELLAGISHMTRRMPSMCVSSLLKPVLSSPPVASVQLELISRMVPSLPTSDFMVLLRHFVSVCSGPLQEWQLSVLNTLLSRVKPDDSASTLECILLDLLPVLSSSARQLSTSESFGSILLKILMCFKSGMSEKVRHDFSAIAHQNNSFSKRAILNALKAL